MKKLTLILVLTLGFAFGINANTSSNFEEFSTDCVSVAMAVHDAWTSQGFTHRFASGRADRAYNECMGI